MVLLSVVPVKILLHQRMQPHRIRLVLQAFPFVIFRLGNIWQCMESEEKETSLIWHAAWIKIIGKDILVICINIQ
jgi:hypothetical protein